MAYRRHRPNPLERLVLAFRAAAYGIDIKRVREIAAREAKSIPLTSTEKAHGAKAEVARQGRAIMADLPNKDADDLPEAARTLRCCADALKSAFHVTSEVKLGERRRRA